MTFKNVYFGLYLISIFLFSCSDTKNMLLVAPVFSDHMVLQQHAQVPLWGSGTPGDTIKVTSSWGEESKSKVQKNGSWTTLLKTPKFGGPFQVKVHSSSNEIEFDDVLIGEVWLTSGQSNMEWPMSARLANQEYEIKNANYPNIRMFSVPRNLNGSNINKASWKVASTENAPSFSAVGYFFAREIYQKLGVPIGIVNSSWGGTRVEAWTSIEKLASMKESANGAKEIMEQGGLESIKEKAVRLNEASRIKNEFYLKEKSYKVPESIEDWSELVLGDEKFYSGEYNDDDWSEFNFDSSERERFTFEFVYNLNNLEADGVMWIRKHFDLDNPDEEFSFIVEGGIDDFDHTYLNGTLIGSELACCTNRKYDIPKGLLKKEGNIIAIRIIDTGGEGGFRGPMYLKSGENRIALDQGNIKYKHTAFLLNNSIQAHNFSTDDLLKDGSLIRNSIDEGVSIQNPNVYSVLYNKMITPIAPFKVKGFLWYQGESNVGNFDEYQSLFSGMIADWREKWSDNNLPFYFVQIAPYIYTPEAQSQELRDAQRKSLELEKTGMAITMDIGEENDIHPANKQDVGLRLARLALHHDYGFKNIIPSGPLYKSHKINKNKVIVYFDYADNGFLQKGPLEGFEIGDEYGLFLPANVRIEKNYLILTNPKLTYPKHVRYGWKNYFNGTLFNKEGLPASSFSSN